MKYNFMKPNAIGEIETYSEKEEIICPYCGYIHDKDYFELPDKMEFDHVLCKCSNCDSKFYLGQTVTVYNETYKIEG